MSDDRTIQSELSPQEAAVVGVMRKSEMARRAIYKYAMNFTG